MIQVKEDITGLRYDRLLVIERIPDRNNHVYYNCLCDCGKYKAVRRDNLKVGDTRSCGCLWQENKSRIGKLNGRGITTCYIYIYNSYRRRANADDIYFDIEKSLFDSLIIQNCHYCNSSPINRYESKAGYILLYNGLDRKDSNLGYTIDNVVSCCWICNNAKRVMSYQSFLEWIDRLIIFRGIKYESFLS